MSYFDMVSDEASSSMSHYDKSRIWAFSLLKFAFDRGLALLVMPIIAVIGIVLLVVNPILNPGPLFFTQIRMGKGRRPFRMVKFRTMTQSDEKSRGPEAGLETSRITRLGHFLRKSRIDEIPNFINVLRGEMSIIGPRPDAWSHGKFFTRRIQGYEDRHIVRPGITGLAQVEAGYADGKDATIEKVRWDLRYIRNYGFRQEARIAAKTVYVMATGFGAK